jgi:hypothetical protein
MIILLGWLQHTSFLIFANFLTSRNIWRAHSYYYSIPICVVWRFQQLRCQSCTSGVGIFLSNNSQNGSGSHPFPLRSNMSIFQWAHGEKWILRNGDMLISWVVQFSCLLVAALALSTSMYFRRSLLKKLLISSIWKWGSLSNFCARCLRSWANFKSWRWTTAN